MKLPLRYCTTIKANNLFCRYVLNMTVSQNLYMSQDEERAQQQILVSLQALRYKVKVTGVQNIILESGPLESKKQVAVKPVLRLVSTQIECKVRFSSTFHVGKLSNKETHLCIIQKLLSACGHDCEVGKWYTLPSSGPYSPSSTQSAGYRAQTHEQQVLYGQSLERTYAISFFFLWPGLTE